MQHQDPNLIQMHEVLSREPKGAAEEQIRKDYLIKNNRVYRKTVNGPRWVVPANVRWRVN